MDPKAINCVLNHADDFRRPTFMRNRLATILGEGMHHLFSLDASFLHLLRILFAEGDDHRRQRKIIVSNISS